MADGPHSDVVPAAGDLLPKVLFVSHSSSWGGAEKCLHLLLEGLPAEKYWPLAVLPRRPLRFSPRGKLEERIRALGVDTRLVDLKWWVGGWRHHKPFADTLTNRINAIARIIREERVDLVFTNTSVVVEGALAARSCGVPHIWHVHEMLSQDPLLNPFLPPDRFYRLMESLSRKLVVVSNAVKAEIEQFAPSGKIEVIHNGIPPVRPGRVQRPKQTLFGFHPDSPVITFVGVHSERKGVLDLIDSARLVLDKFPAARFILAGPDGGKTREARHRIRAYGIGGAVRLLGPRADIADIYAASDVLLLPALADPLPLTVLEAMSAALPVVATRSGGCTEMVIDGRTGYLVPVSDPASLAKATLALLEDPAKRKEMGRRGQRHFAKHFSHPRYVRDFVRVLDEALACPAAPAGNGHAAVATIENELKQLALKRAKVLRIDAPQAELIKARTLAMLRLLSIAR